MIYIPGRAGSEALDESGSWPFDPDDVGHGSLMAGDTNRCVRKAGCLRPTKAAVGATATTCPAIVNTKDGISRGGESGHSALYEQKDTCK